MPKLIPAALLAVLVLAACADSRALSPASVASPSNPAASPSQPTAERPSPVPSLPATPTPPTATPKPTAQPTPLPATAKERYLMAGIQRGAIDCTPVRTALPPRAIAGIDCASDDPTVARVGFYLFRNQADTISAYLQRMAAEGIELDTGNFIDGEGEGAYVPWEDSELTPYRNGCFINDAGYAHYRATLPGEHVYIGVLGRTKATAPLADFAFKGSVDTPGFPTLWLAPEG